MLAYENKLSRLDKINKNIQAEIDLMNIVCQSLQNQVNPQSSQLMQISQKSIVLNESSISRKKPIIPKTEHKSAIMKEEQVNMHSAEYEDCRLKIGQLLNKVSPSSMKSKPPKEKKAMSQSEWISSLMDELRGNQMGSFSDEIIQNLLSKIELEQERYCRNVVIQEGLRVLKKKQQLLTRELAKYQEALENQSKRAVAEEQKILQGNKEIVKIGYNHKMRSILPS